MPLVESDIAYAAGILDGEGCIRVNRQPSGLALRVSITNTDPRLAPWLQIRFGGSVWLNGRRSSPKHKPAFVWEVSARQAGRFLRLVLPYLVLKRERAEIAIAFQDTKGNRGRVPDSVRLKGEVLGAQLTILNRKGVA